MELILNNLNLTMSIILVYILINLFNNKISFNLNLLAKPNKRSIHKIATPFTGGISIFIIFLIIIKTTNYDKNLEEIIVFSSIILFFGLIDDFKEQTPGIKLLTLVIPIIFLVLKNNYIIDNLGNYEILDKISLGRFGIIFTIFSILIYINSFNYIDGIDGLAISQFIIFLLYYCFILSDEKITIFFYLLMLPCLFFLIFNFTNIKYLKSFLGNGGSLMIGFIMSLFSIYICLRKNIHPSIIIWPLSLPIYDFLSVNLYRLSKNENIFKANKIDHIHHVLLKRFNKNQFLVTSILSLLSIMFCFFGYSVFKYFGSIFSIVSFIFIFLIFHYSKINMLYK